jgi:CheY-like chemotaxis protein
MIDFDAVPDADVQTILVVEDEVLIRLFLSDLLRDQGFRVLEAASADEALVYIHTDRCIELVFTDVRMPGLMDGVALVNRLRSDFPHIKTILTSGHMQPGDVEEGTLLIAKPYRLEDAVSKIVSTLNRTETRTDT